MASRRFKRIFLTRFLAYFTMIFGSLFLIGDTFPVSVKEFEYRRDQIFGVKHTLPPQVITSAGESATHTTEQASQRFGDIKNDENIIKPVSTDYGIVIEKINANAKVIPDVDPVNEKSYTKALTQGVAAVSGSTKPGEPGNLYIFSHSADAPWNITRYNAVFYLLREMEKGDTINIFYQGKRYQYIVYDKGITGPKDTSFITNRYDKPVLTLQTCDPPGLLTNRLIVRAKLLGS